MGNYHCRRCLRSKARDFMVLTRFGNPDTLCLACQEYDAMKQEEFRKQRQERSQHGCSNES